MTIQNMSEKLLALFERTYPLRNWPKSYNEFAMVPLSICRKHCQKAPSPKIFEPHTPTLEPEKPATNSRLLANFSTGGAGNDRQRQRGRQSQRGSLRSQRGLRGVGPIIVTFCLDEGAGSGHGWRPWPEP